MRLLDTVFTEYSYDFRQYAHASLKRRVTQAITRLGFADCESLRQGMRASGTVFTQLLRFLTVHVSDMFRDADYFRAFREQVVPALATYPSTKLWVAGCSNGEEVYSLAIILREERLLERTTIYATDIDPECLMAAEAGLYPIDRIALFSENYIRSGGQTSLSDYYTTGYGNAVFDKTLRQNVVFADHSLATDTVFAEVHAVSCRNVLIYFNADLQKHALKLFDDAIVRRGFLGLGSRETLRFSDHARTYAEIPGGQRWYRKL
ncbi:MAG: protein-glutamate O-methyltransferase CheR [Myxococcota bacterium]|nr:CheR family methyltransferase [Myxococcota bacterium]